MRNRKFFCALFVVIIFQCLVSCSVSGDNDRFQKRVVAEIADKMMETRIRTNIDGSIPPNYYSGNSRIRYYFILKQNKCYFKTEVEEEKYNKFKVGDKVSVNLYKNIKKNTYFLK